MTTIEVVLRITYYRTLLEKLRPIHSKSAVPPKRAGAPRDCTPTPRTADKVGRKLSVVRLRVPAGASSTSSYRESWGSDARLCQHLALAAAPHHGREHGPCTVCSDGFGEHAPLMIHAARRSEPSGGLRVREMDHARVSLRYQHRNVVRCGRRDLHRG